MVVRSHDLLSVTSFLTRGREERKPALEIRLPQEVWFGGRTAYTSVTLHWSGKPPLGNVSKLWTFSVRGGGAGGWWAQPHAIALKGVFF